jgi:hypothetical protein
MIPIIDENHPTQKKYVNASLEEILEENKSGIKVVFYIPDRDVSIVLSNKY